MATFQPPPWTPDMGAKSARFMERLRAEKYGGWIDPLGLVRWPSDWRMHLGNGASEDEAYRRVSVNIDEARAQAPQTIWPAGPYDVPWVDLDADAPMFAGQLTALYATQHRPVDDEGWARWSSDYRIHRANGLSHAAAWAKVERDILTIWGVPLPVPTHPFPLVGRLRLTSQGFADDSGLVLPCFAHAGDLFSLYTRDPQRAEAEMDKSVVVGYHGHRVWTLLSGDYWESKDRHVSPQATPGYWDKWRGFCEAMALRQLRIVVSNGDMGYTLGPGPDMRRAMFAQRLAQVESAVQPFLYAFFDGGNESWQTGEPDPRALAQFVQWYRAAGGTAILSLTSPPGEEAAELDAYSIAPADIYDVHSYRGGDWWDKRRHPWSIPYEGKPQKRFGINSEGPGNGELVSASSKKEDLNHEAMACIATACLTARQAYVWFSGEGVRIQRGLDGEQGFASCPRIARMLPRDLMSFTTLHHSGDSWAGQRVLEVPDDVVRIDGASHADGRFVFVVDGPSGTHRLRIARKFTGHVIDPGTGESSPVSGDAGGTLTLSWERGRVFVGQKL